MRAFSPKVNHTAPQVDEAKAHIQAHQFAYGVVTGLVIAGFLARAISGRPVNVVQNLRIHIPAA